MTADRSRSSGGTEISTRWIIRQLSSMDSLELNREWLPTRGMGSWTIVSALAPLTASRSLISSSASTTTLTPVSPNSTDSESESRSDPGEITARGPSRPDSSGSGRTRSSTVMASCILGSLTPSGKVIDVFPFSTVVAPLGASFPVSPSDSPPPSSGSVSVCPSSGSAPVSSSPPLVPSLPLPAPSSPSSAPPSVPSSPSSSSVPSSPSVPSSSSVPSWSSPSGPEATNWEKPGESTW